MTTTTPFWLCAGAAVLLAAAATGAGAQQSPASGASDSAGAAPQQSATQQPGARSMTRRDAADASKPAGFNPRFSPSSERFAQQGGERLYQSICQGCHMPQGQGAKGAGFYPALAKNARLATGAYPTYVVLNGLHGMPPFAQRLDDQQIADVVNYVRTHFGNSYQDAVTAQDVKKQRP
ncbi:cytochrome c [Pulveribacter sp.]|uniref:c-type cytochrome n=1 Tax=Pulveribacter sp. TaxID=2678893 RepID=UPI0028B253F6|nr:cytochrome c [Pulveribacter sp.]